MQRWRAFLAGALEVIAGVAFLVLAHEVVLRFLPVAWAPRVQAPAAADPIQRYQPGTPFTWSLGWDFYVVVKGRTNAQGFVSAYDYDPADARPLVAVIGDSMVEALIVPFAETLTGRLQAMLQDPRARLQHRAIRIADQSICGLCGACLRQLPATAAGDRGRRQ